MRAFLCWLLDHRWQRTVVRHHPSRFEAEVEKRCDRCRKHVTFTELY